MYIPLSVYMFSAEKNTLGPSSPFRKGNTTAGSTGLLGINSITNEAVVRDFLIPFARDLDLKPRIAIDIIEAGVTSKLKSLMLQAVVSMVSSLNWIDDMYMCVFGERTALAKVG